MGHDGTAHSPGFGAMAEDGRAIDAALALAFMRMRLRWSFLVAGLIVGAGIGVTISLLVPESFVARASFIPSQSSDNLSAIRQLASGFANLELPSGSTGSQPEMFPAIVSSRRITGALLQSSFRKTAEGDSVRLIDLVEPHGEGQRRMDRAIVKLRGVLHASVDRRTGIVSVEMTSHYPSVAAGVVNECVVLLQEFLNEALSSSAMHQRVFVEGRLNDTAARLRVAEDAVLAFQEKNVRYGSSPRLKMEEARLSRSLSEQQEVYLTLMREFELARIAEHKDTPQLTILDVGVPPTSHNWPKRRLLVGSFAVFGVLAGSFLAVRRPT